MDYRRTYWLLFFGIGVLFGVQAAVPVLTGTAVDLTIAVSAVAAVAIVGIAAYALQNPGAAGGPDEPSLLFFVAVVAFLFLLAGTVVQVAAI